MLDDFLCEAQSDEFEDRYLAEAEYREELRNSPDRQPQAAGGYESPGSAAA